MGTENLDKIPTKHREPHPECPTRGDSLLIACTIRGIGKRRSVHL